MSMRRVITAALISLAAAVLVAGGVMAVVLFGGSSGDLSYRTLDYDVQVLGNGDLQVTQHIDMRLNDRSDDDAKRPWKQLYQQYTLKSSNLTAITDVSVKNATTGETYAQIAPRSPSGVGDATWDSEYAKHWYIADVTGSDSNPQPYDAQSDAPQENVDKTVEVGWNIPATPHANSLKFDVSMTLQGVSTAYSDVASLQWAPFSDRNQIPIGTVTGTVTFPEGIDKSNSWAWLHFSGTSQTSRTDDGGLRFTAYDVRAGQHLDLVAMFDVDATSGVERRSSEAHKGTLIASENEQERQWRSSQRAAAIRDIVITVVVALVGAACAAWGVLAAIRSNKAARYHGDIEYYRDPPDMSPASAAKLLNVVDDHSPGPLTSRQMAASVLSLASKKAVAIYPGPASTYVGIDMSVANQQAVNSALGGTVRSGRTLANTSTIVIMPVCHNDRPSLHLAASEDAALALLETAAARIGSPVFDLAQMKDSFRKWEQGYKLQQRFETAVSNEFAMLGATASYGGQAIAAGILNLVIGIGALLYFVSAGHALVAFLLAAPVLFFAVFVLISNKVTGLTERGQELAGQVIGLKRYLVDFSDFSDRGSADLTLWDRYLVYAAAFGISDKVLSELAKAYPQLSDPQWLDEYGYGSLLYWTYRPSMWGAYGGLAGSNAGMGGFDPSSFSANVGDIGAQLSSGFADIQSTIQAASPSSSSGGSFSGGGFGGSGGGSGGGSFGGR